MSVKALALCLPISGVKVDVMKTNHFRFIVLAGLALVGLATGAAAQEKANLLTTIEVQRLETSAQPGDYARLSDHFAALADQYAAQARRNIALSRTPTGNPNRRSGGNPGPVYARRAEIATESAATTRELAGHYGRLAAGMPSTPPANSARFVAGEGVPAPTDTQLGELAAGARTPADHRSLEEYYRTLATKYANAAEDHARLGRAYRASAIRSLDPAIHCDRMVKVSREAANKARATAAEHGQLAHVG